MPQSWMLMLMGLGFMLALLASLIIGRLFWLYTARRRKLAERRVAPIEQMSLEADRDRLRVENAMLSVRLERTERNLKGRLAERMAEAARHRNRLDAAMAEIARLRGQSPAIAAPVPPLPPPSPTPAAAPDASPAGLATPEDAAAARLRRRIENLSALSQQIERKCRALRRRRTDPPSGAQSAIAAAEQEANEIERDLGALAKPPRKPR